MLITTRLVQACVFVWTFVLLVLDELVDLIDGESD